MRGLARGLGASEREVASPTFALLHEYGADGRVRLRHLDLYRLPDDPRQLEVLGFPDAFAGAPVCVEWPRAGIQDAAAGDVGGADRGGGGREAEDRVSRRR